MAKQIIWDSKLVDEAIDKINNGFVLKRIENPFYEGTIGLRKPGMTFRMTQHELEEYVKCKSDVQYFAQNYCWVKGEKGEPVKLKLRDYQEDILDNFFHNRFNILMASRQIGKCFSYGTSLFIYDNHLEVYKNIKFYELLYEIKENKTIYDHLKYIIYKMIFLLD